MNVDASLPFLMQVLGPHSY